MLGLWQVLLFEVLQSSFLHPGCAEAVGEGGREPLQGLGKSGERLTPAALCSHLAAAHMPALYPEEGMRDAHEKLPRQASLQILPLLPLVWALPFNSHLFLAGNLRNCPFDKAKSKAGIREKEARSPGCEMEGSPQAHVKAGLVPDREASSNVASTALICLPLVLALAESYSSTQSPHKTLYHKSPNSRAEIQQSAMVKVNKPLSCKVSSSTPLTPVPMLPT